MLVKGKTRHALSKKTGQEMKKLFLITILIGVLSPGLLNAFQLKADTRGGHIAVRSDYDRLCQGEILKISLSSTVTISGAQALFNGREFVFVANEGKSSFFTLIGIGLDTEPGNYDLAVTVSLPDGRERHFNTKIAISEGTFRLRRINVDRKFISPSRKDEERIVKEIALTKDIYGKSETHWLGRGNFILPVKGTLAKNFGDRRIFNDNRRSRHRGIDIRSPAGRIVRAVNSGRVVMTRDLYFAGQTVIIDHGIGLFSMYCHLSKLSVKEGTAVKKGQEIGRVGSTGRVTGPHLHWGIRLSDTYVNPLSLLHLSFD
jgi:murein DD-endopeptidase MepM/ murein hydrolase activator NlpD